VATPPTITIDCASVRTREDFWREYLAAAEPEEAGYFGRNLDALWDALAGGPGWPGECVLRIVNTSSLKSIEGGRFYDALAVIARDSRTVKVVLE
jgi:RNAse (barnase) inhibitor barstar